MRNERKAVFFLSFGLLICVVGCALVKPTRNFDESNLIDWGLGNTFDSSVAIVPFTAENQDWGVYAAQRMKEYLLEEKAFKRIIYSEDKNPKTAYILTGDLEHIEYGGTDTPTMVFLRVKIIRTDDGQTRFLRTAKASSKKSAYHVTLVRRLFIPAPYPEEVMNGVLRHIAHDIALRSTSPAVQSP
jgi:hypothetical protein